MVQTTELKRTFSELFSVRGSDHCIPELNPILAEGNPTYTGGVIADEALCKVVRMLLGPEGTITQYKRG